MGDDALFVPAVSLHNDAFVHAAGIIDFLIAEIFSSDAEFSQDHIAYKTLREACKTSGSRSCGPRNRKNCPRSTGMSRTS